MIIGIPKEIVFGSNPPTDASQRYVNNIFHIIKHLFRKKTLDFDLEDGTTRETSLRHQGEIVHQKIKRLCAIEHRSGGLSC